MAPQVTRRTALVILGGIATGIAAAGLLWRGVPKSSQTDPTSARWLAGWGMGEHMVDMQAYRTMFSRHTEINRRVDEIHGGVRTVTESASPDLAAQLQAHVTAMYERVSRGEEVMCMSASLPTLFRNAAGYRRQLTFTETGIIAEEVTEDPVLAKAIRDHAVEVSGFVENGMPAMMEDMMNGGMMPGHRG